MRSPDPCRLYTFGIRGLAVVLCCILSFACGEKDEAYVEKPAYLISKDRMVSFLVDLHLAEAKMSYMGVKNQDSLEVLFRNYEQYLFEKHQIEDSAYYQSYQYYLSHMNQMDQIYEAVVDSLNVLNSKEKAKD